MTSSASSSRPNRLPQPSGGALLLAGTGLFLFFAATNVQSGWLYALDALLWAVWAWDLVAASRRLPAITASRLIPHVTAAGEPLSLVVTLRPQAPLRGVEVVELGLQHDGEGVTGTRTSLGYVRESGAGEAVTRQGTLTAPARGRYAFTSLHLIRYGPMGLFRRRFTVPCQDLIWVHPPIGGWPGDLRFHDAEGNATGATRRLGAAGLFAGVRDYRPGDSLRQIHWPLTARRGVISVKELEPPPALRLTLALALSGRGETTEAAVAAAGALAHAAWIQAIPLTLAGPGRTWEPQHWGEVLEWLADAAAGPLPEPPADPGAVVLICDGPPPAQWSGPLAAAYGPAGGAVGTVPVLPLPEPVKASLSG